MKVTYKLTGSIIATFPIDPDKESLDDLKSEEEYEQALTEFICDEITTAGGVGLVEFDKTMILLEEWE